MIVMRSNWIIVFAFIIALTSGAIDLRGTVVFEQDQVESAPQLKSNWESDSLYHQGERYNKDTHVIAQDFIPIVVIAEAYDLNRHFNFYFPIYNLYRQKEYFLLI